MELEKSNKRVGKTTIAWMPKHKNVVVKENKELEAKLLKTNLITTNNLSDAELQSMGLPTKSATLANQTSEEQEVFEIVAIGPDVSGTEIGEKVIFMPGCQATSIKVKDKFYLQLGEYEILGNFLED